MLFDNGRDDLRIFLAEPAKQCCRHDRSARVIWGKIVDCAPGTPILAIRKNCVGDVSYSVVMKNLGIRSCAA
jgi:hypothetical protein